MLAFLAASAFIAQAWASPLSTSHLAQPRAANGLPDLAPLLSSSTPDAHIPNSYIVVLKEDTDILAHTSYVEGTHAEDPLQDLNGSGLNHIYDGNIKGYSGAFSEGTIEKIRTLPEVEYIERDQVVWASEIEKGAPWGLARISHRNKLGFGTFREYHYEAGGGEGVDAYVIDTGINIHHAEFEGRAIWGKTIPKNDVDEDANGHGTHCAGTIASRTYGVAKSANVIAVKVLGSNGSGSMSDVLAGVTWASTQAKKKAADAAAEFARTGKTYHKGSVANMSLGGGKSRALDDAVNRAVDDGLHFAVAAGNENKDACNTSPAGAEKAITVGASTLADTRAYFSNHGPCVDVFAPGLNILSTWKGGNATNTISGTSMASPHVCGLLAYLLSIYPSATFDPTIKESLAPGLSLESTITSAASSSVYAAIHATLPVWASAFLPSPVSGQSPLGVAPIPAKGLTPAQLKAALLDLSSPDLLTDIPEKTINLLVFNNATQH